MASTASQVQVLLGTKNELFRELYAPLLSNIIAHFTTIEVDYTKVKELFTDGKPRVVLAVDGHLTRRNYEGLHAQLAEYTKGGGAVICCCNFSSFCRPPDLNRFLARFGFQWKCGDYQRTTFAVNIAFKHIFGASAFSELETSCSMKALHVANVPCDDRIYGPTSMSRTESRVFPAESVDQSQSPAALGRCGEGYLGYLGDVNNEECSQALLMVMISTLCSSRFQRRVELTVY